MKALPRIQQQGASDYHEGVPLGKNPWNYTSDIFKAGAWAAGWNNEKLKEIKKRYEKQ